MSVISKEAQVLLKLLSIALGTEEVYKPFPLGEALEVEQWKEVVRLSYEHKVSALAVDGLQASQYDPYKGLDGAQAAALKAVLDPWRMDVENTENSYAYYVEALKTLCQLFKDNGLTPILLKGYGLSLNYPKPSHRGAGDIDLFLMDKDGRLATEQGVALMARLLGIKAHKEQHHYAFAFLGLSVELHYDVTDVLWNSESETYMVERLREMVLEGCTPCPGIESALLPSAMFNAVFLMRHSFGHCTTASCKMRQYVDWMLFVQRHHPEVDWVSVRHEWQKGGMLPFADGLCTLLHNWLNLDLQLCPTGADEAQVEAYILCDIDHVILNGRHLHQRVRYFYTYRKKLKLLTQKGWISLLCYSVYVSAKQLFRKLIQKPE